MKSHCFSTFLFNRLVGVVSKPIQVKVEVSMSPVGCVGRALMSKINVQISPD